jgi:hypothetical protein
MKYNPQCVCLSCSAQRQAHRNVSTQQSPLHSDPIETTPIEIPEVPRNIDERRCDDCALKINEILEYLRLTKK